MKSLPKEAPRSLPGEGLRGGVPALVASPRRGCLVCIPWGWPTSLSEEGGARDTPGEGPRCCSLRGGGGERPLGGASTRAGSPGALCLDDAPVTAPVSSLREVSWRGSEKPGRGGPSRGHRLRGSSEEGPRGGGRVGLPDAPPRRSVGDDPVRGSLSLPPRRRRGPSVRGSGLSPPRRSRPGSLSVERALWRGSEKPHRRVRPGERARAKAWRECRPWGSEEPRGGSSRGPCGGGRSEEVTPTGPRDHPPALRGGGGGSSSLGCKAGRARLQGIELDRESVLPARGD